MNGANKISQIGQGHFMHVYIATVTAIVHPSLSSLLSLCVQHLKLGRNSCILRLNERIFSLEKR